MSREPQSKDEALDALDFIVNVLREHEKTLDKLIGELSSFTSKLAVTGELGGKVDKVEQKMNGLQNEITRLVNFISASQREAPVVVQEQKAEPVATPKKEITQPLVTHGRPVILRCKQWDDFQNLAFQAQAISFMYKEAEKTFQAQALKGDQIVTYSGEVPKLTALLKMWLSKQLDISEKQILEGALAIG